MPIGLHGLRVATFASRGADEMVGLIERYGGESVSAPSMCEAPLESNRAVQTFAAELFAGRVDMVLLLTGVGTRMLVRAMAADHPVEEIAAALRSVVTVARGPKPVAALAEMELEPTITVPDPSTWKDLVTALSEQHPVQAKRIAVQEYGRRNPHLIEALERRGAEVLSVPVYRWCLPEDVSLLRGAIDRVAAGQIEFVAFTSSTQVRHLFEVARKDGTDDKLHDALASVCIGSIGPMATEAVNEHGLATDFEPDSPRMSNLVHGLARVGRKALDRKRAAAAAGVDTNRWRRTDMVWPTAVPGISESVFMKACRLQPTPYTPVWLMRQAGRYQRAYRAIRARVSLLELCKTPELAAEVTLMAVDQLDVDAAIIFSDILLLLEPMGLNLQFVRGDGPKIDPIVRSGRDVDRLRRPEIDELGFVFDAIGLARRALRPDLALIGFAGGPFTIASYMIEGGKSRNFVNTKTLMYTDPSLWDALMERMCDLLARYLNAQIDAGADAVQIFDSWAGALGPDDYRRHVLRHVRGLIDRVDQSVPLIHFTTGNPSLLPLVREAGGHVIGLDWRVDLADAWDLLGHDVAVMGNLDPVVLYGSTAGIRARVREVLDKAGGRPGHIFNLGHGILPTMSPDHVAEMVDAVHELSAR